MPLATTRPRFTTATRSQTSSTSDSRCEFRKTVTPRSRAARMIWRTSVRPTGSRADVGSSRKTSSGRAEQGGAQPEPLLHPLRERPDRIVRPVGQADGLERRVDLGHLPRRSPAGGPARHGAGGPRGRAATTGSGTARAGSRSAGGSRDRRSGRRGPVPLPEVAAVRPRRSLTEVVLPAPFGPRKPKTSPGSTRIDRPASATVRPNRFESSNVSIAGAERCQKRIDRALMAGIVAWTTNGIEAAGQVVVDEADALHEGVGDRRAHEPEAACAEVPSTGRLRQVCCAGMAPDIEVGRQ